MALKGAIPPVAYSDPWNLGLPQRLKMLSRGNRRVAYFYERPDNSTFRYRIYNMAQVLNEVPSETSAAYFFLDDLHSLELIAEKADLLVICRTRYDDHVNQLITAFHSRRKRVLFDVDDLVFDPDYAHLIMRTLDQDPNAPGAWDHWFAYTSRLGATLSLCDGAITTNEFLAEQIAKYAGIPVSIIPNFLNREQIEISDRIYTAKQQAGVRSETEISLGYFSGSPSHNNDFRIVVQALESALEEDPRLGVVVVGHIQAGAGLKRFGARVKWYPFHDFINLQRLVGMVDFNLMPLQYNTFTNSKSELKFFEAAIVGTLCIASPTFAYAKAIRDGDNGYLAQAHQWTGCIRRAVSDIGDNKAMAERAYEGARSKYAWSNQRATVLSALDVE